jgi:serine/threonine-protein kinase HipA
MSRKANVLLNDTLAGSIEETDEGYTFSYNGEYLTQAEALPVSLTLPLTSKPYQQTILFPFFDGLIPEGWLLDVAERTWKLPASDRFGLLLVCCQNCIGAVSIIPVATNE